MISNALHMLKADNEDSQALSEIYSELIIKTTDTSHFTQMFHSISKLYALSQDLDGNNVRR